MIIGAKRKEEVIKPVKNGVYQEYFTRPIRPVVALSLYKGISKWEIWEKIESESGILYAYRPIAGYRKRADAEKKLQEISHQRNLPIVV